ncbi:MULTISPECIES: ribonuclease E/G [Halocynthiibacter]|uniref:Ribonuclease E/G n=1 Tax=Halocynthiibacter halioticoli TaxID=2986804 RepID=A0AAE3LR41_9RHOB|nr:MULTISPECIES: ribonuclease E/G [Halocynthiibacter]MCV6825162.1 ribonuclease E/G [Halocynthiibacter halioticoli]MCW4058163.1 ribonuclease E/G [Halocynthiibacter sp. SDUM655004]
MKGSVVALDQWKGRGAAAMLVDGKLTDLLIDPAAQEMPVPGTIYRAICDRPLKGQGGMMLRIPDGTAFLRQGKGLAPGQSIFVQVTGFAEEGKAVPVTQKILFKSRYAIVTPNAPGVNISRAIRDDDIRDELMELAKSMMEGVPHGLILRSICEHSDHEEIADDIALMLGQADGVLDADDNGAELLLDGPDAQLLAWRDWPAPDVMAANEGSFADYEIDSMVSETLDDYVPLSGGASMYVEPTRALVAVDINTGGDTSVAAGLKANIAAARDLPRQMRIRGLGGQITLDLAPMTKKDRQTFESVLRAAFKADSIDTALVGFTPLGHYELQRKRERLPLKDCVE